MRPSGDTATLSTEPEIERPVKVAVQERLATSHTRMVPFPLPLTSVRPSGVNATHDTA
jgi:hypothetical protein